MTMNLPAERSIPAERLVGMQYLRAVAAVLVVCYQSFQMVGMPKYLGDVPWDGFWKMGFIGVDLFFVVSGFVIVLFPLMRDGITGSVGMSSLQSDL